MSRAGWKALCLQGLYRIKQFFCGFHSILAAKHHPHAVCHGGTQLCGLLLQQCGIHSAQGYQFLHEILTGADWAPVLDCVRYHHASELHSVQDTLPKDSPAYIIYLADNFSAAADRREIEGEGSSFRRDLPLDSVFTHLNGSHPGWMMPAQPQDGSLKLPQKQHPLSASVYADAVRKLKECLPDLQPQPEWINSLMGLLETQFSCFPSSTFTGESPDVSLFDHAKTTAAIAACISEYVQANNITDLRKALFEQEKDFCQKDAFLLYTADFSRIQKFLYTVHTEKALRSLRGRSFFLELLMEHYLDELLAVCGVSRANLIYSGGGHCYALLPNTSAVLQTVAQWSQRFNRWLQQQFGTQLFLANAWTPCSGSDLTNTPAEKSPYKELFRRVNRLLEQHKFHRYTAEDLRQLNSTAAYPDGRECKVCGTSANLKDDLCPWCKLFVDLSIKIQNKRVLVVSRQPSAADDCTLPALDGGSEYLSLTDPASARKRLNSDEPIVRVYTKNAPFTSLTYSTNLYVGDYAASNSMEELAGQSQGVRRIAVCRMDVDNLGHAFISGFEQENEKDPVKRMHYVTLSRTSAFSRQMSLFFKCYINGILDSLHVSIVYAGGDDVFLVGAWNDVLEAAQRIQRNFTAFSCGALTLSAGIGIFDDHYPIRLSAEETAALEESAKHLPGKNAVALFTPERKAVRDAKGNLLVQPEQGHIYAWDTFRAKVLTEKVGCLQSFFGKDNAEHRNTMLYNLLALLREAENDRINLARYAYLLARLSPKKNAPDYKLYEQFSHSMMDWALDAVQRHQLITAIYIYVYQNRKGGDTDGRME